VKLLRNLVLFFAAFLPLSCATGLGAGWFTGPLEPPRVAYDVGLFVARVLPLLLPSFLAVPVLHFTYRAVLRDQPKARARWIAAIVTPLALLAVHLVAFGHTYFTPQLVVLFLIPGAIYGALFALPRPT